MCSGASFDPDQTRRPLRKEWQQLAPGEPLRQHGLGNRVRFKLLPGQHGEITRVPDLIEGLSFDALMADTAFDADDLRKSLRENGAEAVITAKRNRKIHIPTTRKHAFRAAIQRSSATNAASSRQLATSKRSPNGGLRTKIYATCDTLGNPLGFHLTPQEACDLDGADHLIGDIRAGILLADKGYDADVRLIEPLPLAGKQVVIPPKSNRKTQRYYDKALNRARYLIEIFFGKLKHFRAIATRYDKPAIAFLGAVYLAASLIWLK